MYPTGSWRVVNIFHRVMTSEMSVKMCNSHFGPLRRYSESCWDTNSMMGRAEVCISVSIRSRDPWAKITNIRVILFATSHCFSHFEFVFQYGLNIKSLDMKLLPQICTLSNNYISEMSKVVWDIVCYIRHFLYCIYQYNECSVWCPYVMQTVLQLYNRYKNFY